MVVVVVEVQVAVAEPELPHLCPQHSWFLSGSAWQKQTQRGGEN